MRLEKSVSDDINAVRGLAALGVIWAHTMAQVRPAVTVNGAFWVWVFFATSGYLQGSSFASGRYSLTRAGAIRFWKNRARRILPLFWLVLSLALVLRFVVAPASIEAFEMARQYLALTTFYSLLEPLWSIAAEIHLYLLAPFLCGMLAPPGRPFGRLILLGVGVLGFALAMWLGDTSAEPRSGIGNALIFVAGLIAAYRLTPFLKLSQLWRGVLFFAAVGVAGVLEHTQARAFWTLKGGAVLAVLAAYLVFATPRLSHVPKVYAIIRAPLVVVGRYCYGTYVYSALIGEFARRGLGMHPGVGMLALELLGLPLAFASFHLFECHFSRSGLPGMAKDSVMPEGEAATRLSAPELGVHPSPPLQRTV